MTRAKCNDFCDVWLYQSHWAIACISVHYCWTACDVSVPNLCFVEMGSRSYGKFIWVRTHEASDKFHVKMLAGCTSLPFLAPKAWVSEPPKPKLLSVEYGRIFRFGELGLPSSFYCILRSCIVECCSCPWSCFRPEVWHDGGGRGKTTNKPSRYVPGVLLCHITRYQRCAVCLLCVREVMYSAVFVIPSVCLTAGLLWKLWMNVCKVLLRCTVGGKEFDGDLDWNPRISKKILFFVELSLSSHC